MENPKPTTENRSKLVHNIRTCLAVIKTASEVALLDSTLSPDITELLQNNIKEVDRANEIAGQLI